MFGFGNKLFTSNKRPARKATFKPHFEALERREVMSLVHVPVGVVPTTGVFLNPYVPPSPTPAGLALINSLPDTPVRTTALTDYQRDGQITRNDMIDIFYSASNGFTYLLPGALASVQTLVSNGPTVAMPDYVQALSGKVIGGISGLGQAPAQIMNQHVDNFFLGQAHPNPGQYPTYTTPNKWVTATYQQVSEPLWNPAYGPSHLDVHYTGNGDSALVWSLQDVACDNAGYIGSMFIDNGDGTYTVRLYNSQTHKPDYVTVDSYLPYKAANYTDAGGNIPQVPVGGADVKPYLWPALAEKAFAQEYGLSYPQLANVSQAAAWYTFTGLSIKSSTFVNPNTIAAEYANGSFVILNGNGTVVETTNNDVFQFRGDFIILGTPSASADWFSLRNVGGVGYVVEVPPWELASFFKSWYKVQAVTTNAGQTSGRYSTILGNLETGSIGGLLSQSQANVEEDTVYEIARRIPNLPTHPPKTSVSQPALYVDKAMLNALKEASTQGIFFLPQSAVFGKAAGL